jgi:hypothetical protein
MLFAPALSAAGSSLTALVSGATGWRAVWFGLVMMIGPYIINVLKTLGVGVVSYYALSGLGGVFESRVLGLLDFIPPMFLDVFVYLKVTDALSIVLTGITTGLALKAMGGFRRTKYKVVNTRPGQ